jgi:hypothetical protein
MNELWNPLFPFALFFAWLFFFGMGHRKACPDWNKPLSLCMCYRRGPSMDSAPRRRTARHHRSLIEELQSCQS